MRWGFLGAGFVASRAMAPAVHAAGGAVLQVVGARDVTRAQGLDPVRSVSDYAEVCHAQDVDAVYLALPNDDHLPWALEALAAGKHVLCEKPLGRSAAEVARMTAAAQQSGLLLVEAAWNRWHPRTQRFAELVASLRGRCEVRARFTFPGVPEGNYRLDTERGGGALLDVGCYGVAAALVALGSAVDVESVQRQLGPTGVDLRTHAVLSSVLGTAAVTASIDDPEAQGLTVESPGCSIEFVGPAFTTWNTPSELRIVSDGIARVEQFPACDPYQLMIEAVSARIRGEAAWVLPLSTSWAVAATLDAIRRHP